MRPFAFAAFSIPWKRYKYLTWWSAVRAGWGNTDWLWSLINCLVSNTCFISVFLHEMKYCSKLDLHAALHKHSVNRPPLLQPSKGMIRGLKFELVFTPSCFSNTKSSRWPQGLSKLLTVAGKGKVARGGCGDITVAENTDVGGKIWQQQKHN